MLNLEWGRSISRQPPKGKREQCRGILKGLRRRMKRTQTMRMYFRSPVTARVTNEYALRKEDTHLIVLYWYSRFLWVVIWGHPILSQHQPYVRSTWLSLLDKIQDGQLLLHFR